MVAKSIGKALSQPFPYLWTPNVSLYRQWQDKFYVYRDDLFVRLPEGGQSPKQKVNLQRNTDQSMSRVRWTWFKRVDLQGTEVLMRQIPRLCQYFRVRKKADNKKKLIIKEGKWSKKAENQPDAGEEERSVPPLQKYKSEGLFHVHTWIFSCSFYPKVWDILLLATLLFHSFCILLLTVMLWTYLWYFGSLALLNTWCTKYLSTAQHIFCLNASWRTNAGVILHLLSPQWLIINVKVDSSWSRGHHQVYDITRFVSTDSDSLEAVTFY